LTEKVIETELSGHDRYVNTGNGEFLVFFADATPQESRIRCLAIVETLRVKLFGDEPDAESLADIAECHLVHRDEIAFEWETQKGAVSATPGRVTSRLRPPQDAQILDRSQIVLSSQHALDSILGQALGSVALEELGPLLLRLKCLSRSLKTLEPMLARADSERIATAWEDIVALISVLDADAERSLAERLGALTKLQRRRTERTVEIDPATAEALRKLCETDRGKFEYAPFYRSEGKGDRILQGIYRVEPPVPAWGNYLASRDELGADPFWRDYMIKLERAILAHALDCLLEREPGGRFMLMASLHVDTLRGPHSQMQYSTLLRSVQTRCKRRLLIEAVGYREGDDTIGVRRAVDELLAHANGVFVTFSQDVGNIEKAAAQCKNLGAHAVGLDVFRYGDQNRAVFAALKSLAQAAEQHAISWYVSGIGSIPVLAKAIAGGAHYVSAPVVRPPLASPNEMEAVSLEDLYATV
jgi:hypothetical protein